MASAVVLEGEARDVALAEAQAVLALVSDPERRERLRSLVGAADEGAVDGEDADALEELLELGLTTGRLRALYGPGGEQALLRLYRRLPGGIELAQSATAVGEALSGLQGRTLESVALTAVGPGSFSLTVAAGGVQVKVHLDRQGARLASVEA
jgi:hypothetical protein